MTNSNVVLEVSIGSYACYISGYSRVKGTRTYFCCHGWLRLQHLSTIDIHEYHRHHFCSLQKLEPDIMHGEFMSYSMSGLRFCGYDIQGEESFASTLEDKRSWLLALRTLLLE